HRLTDRFDDVSDDRGGQDPRVFLVGDACHTHSAKAGQGMNVSMQDGYNLGWKLAHVVRGRSAPDLLATYADERMPVARSLVEFDRERARMSSARPEDLPNEEALQQHYAESAEFTAGFSVHYPPGRLIGESTHQHLATGFPIGRRFHSSAVVRLSDVNPVELGHLHEADGRWRLYAFADGPRPGAAPALAAWADWLHTASDSPVRTHARDGDDLDALIDVKVVFPSGAGEFDVTDVPEVFLPAVGRFGLRDQGKVFVTDPASDIFAARGIDPGGAVVVVRPDQYVAHVLPLTHTQGLAEFFTRVFS
ncbi:MAG: FAD-dependent monooxygenase, partial [Propionibacteriaceae bacterium]|nr:FAD-dependent monooxygenase [Propionibacteriaceae bacterium]